MGKIAENTGLERKRTGKTMLLRENLNKRAVQEWCIRRPQRACLTRIRGAPWMAFV